MNAEKIKVQVHYIAAGKPFMSDEPATLTVGQLKTQVLEAFGLKEDSQKQFKLFLQKTELSNPSQTLGDVAGKQGDLNLKLEEVLVQGC